MPVTVPVNSAYAESSLLTSPQQSVSPRPPSHDMLDVNGQYPASVASPVSPGPQTQSASSPSPQSLKRAATSPDGGGGQMAANRNNSLRVVIPGPGGREAADNNGLGAASGSGLSYGHNHGHGSFQSDFGEVPLQHWNQSHLQLNNHK